MMISVVIPVHNREDLIKRAIESAVGQTTPVDEIIVVDDASTDQTAHVVAEIAKTRPNLTLISLKENQGAANARNVGIEAAKSDLIAFLDSDDLWYPDKLAKQVREFEKDKDTVAVYCGMVQMIKTYKEYRHPYIPKPSITQTDLYHSSVVGTMSSALILKQTLLDIGGFDASLPSCEDWDLFIRLSARGKMSVVQEELVEYWRHKGDRISRNKQSVLAGHEAVFEKIYSRISDPFLKRKVRASHERQMADIFSIDFFEPVRAIKHSCTGLILAPSSEGWRNFQSVIKSSVKNAIFRWT